MKHLKSCLSKGNLLGYTILLRSILFIEIGLYIDENCILEFQCSQILYFFIHFYI